MLGNPGISAKDIPHRFTLSTHDEVVIGAKSWSVLNLQQTSKCAVMQPPRWNSYRPVIIDNVPTCITGHHIVSLTPEPQGHCSALNLQPVVRRTGCHVL